MMNGREAVAITNEYETRVTILFSGRENPNPLVQKF